MDDLYRKLLKDILESKEGRSDTVYEDHKGNPTVGVGTNLSHPETLDKLTKAGLSPERVLAGEPVPQEIQNKLLEDSLKEQEGKLDEKIPGVPLKENERAALMSMMYNSSSLVGPKLQEFLKQGNKEDAAREILLNSNRDKNPGLASRRMEESAMFNDSKLPPINMEQEANLKGTLSGIENKNEKERVFKRLSDLLNSK